MSDISSSIEYVLIYLYILSNVVHKLCLVYLGATYSYACLEWQNEVFKMQIFIHIHTQTHTYMYMRTYACMYMHIYAYTYTHIHTYIHMRTLCKSFLTSQKNTPIILTLSNSSCMIHSGKHYFSYFGQETQTMGTRQNCLVEALVSSPCNPCSEQKQGKYQNLSSCNFQFQTKKITMYMYWRVFANGDISSHS